MCIIIAPVMAATQYSLEAYTLAPNAKWTSGNTKGYLEGQFVPYRLGITNYPGVATEPQECIEIDYHANSGEYGFDKADFFYIGPVGDTNTPVPGTPPNTYGAGFTPITTNNAAAFWVDTAPTEVTTSTGTLLHYCVHFNTAPGTNFAIYWGSHLARTSYPISKDYGVQTYTPDVTYEGASYYPGSSLHTHATPANRDVSQPTPPASAEKTGMKFNDANGNHVKDGTEAGLGGWTIYVDINGDGQLTPTGLDPEPFAITSSAPATLGQYHIFGIPAPGSGTTPAWPVREVNQNGWVCSYPTTVDAFGCKYTESFTSGVVETGNDFGNLVPTPEVSKTAAGTYDETHTWTVKKTVDPASVVGFAGDTLPYTWKIVVDDTPTLGNYAVKGIITVKNTDPGAQMVVDLTDKLDDGTSAVIANSVSCAYSGTTLTIPAGATASCAYTATPSGTTATLNTATVKLGAVTKTATAKVEWTKNVIDGSATLTDDHGVNKAETGDDTVTVLDKYVCPTDPSKYTNGVHGASDTNTAKLAWDKTISESKADETITCYNSVPTKTAVPSYTKTWEWKIDKKVTPEGWSLVNGDKADSKYVVSVTATDEKSKFAVKGTITVPNPNPGAPLVVTLTDVLNDGAATPGIISGCTGGTWASPILTVPAGGTAVCSYTATPSGMTATLNTATVKMGLVTTTATANVDWNAADVTEDYAKVDVYDVFDGGNPVFLGTAKADAGTTPFTYFQEFTCGESHTYPNKAYIKEPYAEINKLVEVKCRPLNGNVVKDAPTEFTRKYEWTIDKTSKDPNLNPTLKLDPQQTYLLPYEVTVNAKQLAASGFLVSGTITTTNNDEREAKITSFSDVITPVTPSGSIPPNLACDPVGVVLAPLGGKLDCKYSADLTSNGAEPDTTFGTNGVNVDLEYKTYKFPWDWPASPPIVIGTGTFKASGSADIKFASTPTYEWDKCAQINDVTYGVDLGKVCYPNVPYIQTYKKLLGPYPDCQNTEVKNCADFVTEVCTSNGCKATPLKGEDCFTFIVEVPCPGCTLTPGYWKTHVEKSRNRGPPYDKTWGLLDANSDLKFQGSYEPFFGLGKDWYDTFWTNPKGGDAYYILSFQYEAAVLNGLAGAPHTVDTEISEAAALLDKYDTLPGVLTGKNKLYTADRARMIYLAGILGDYNGGKLHCDEDSTSAK